VTITFTLFGNIATFYPPYRTEHHPSINDTMVGTVLAMFEIGYLICSPIISMTMAKVGRKNFILIGNLAQIFSSLALGLLVYVKNDMVFYIISLALRFMQGFGDAAGTTAFFSIIAIEFSKE
jgi:MFS family permease